MTYKLFSPLFLLLLLVSCRGEAQVNKNVGKSNGNAIEVIDFHTTHRCKTCLAIENTAKEVLNSNFSTEMQSGKIIFKTVNVDEAANGKIAEQFEASGSALFIYNPKTGDAVDMTDFAFTYGLSDPGKLKEAIKAAVLKALQG